MLLELKPPRAFFVFLPIWVLPFVHLPFEVLTPIEMLNIKMLYVLPAAILILFSTGRFISPGISALPVLAILLLNFVSLIATRGGEYPFHSFITLLGFNIAFYGIYKSSFTVSEIYLFLKTIITIAVILALYSLLLQLGINLLDFHSYDTKAGPFPNRNFLGGYMGFSLLFTSFFILKGSNNIPLIISAVIIGDALILSETRGAWLSFLTGMLFIILLDIRFYYSKSEEWKQTYREKAPVFVLIVLLVFTSSWIINTVKLQPMDIKERLLVISDFKNIFLTGDFTPLETTESASVKMRYLYWRMAKEMIQERPISGRGIGHFREEYSPYLEKYLLMDQYKSAYKDAPIGVDNDFLEFWVEGGVFNLLAYIVLISFAYIRVYKLCNATNMSVSGKEHAHNFLAGALLGGLTVIVTHGLFHYSIHDPTMGMFFWVTTALISVITEDRKAVHH